MRKRLLTRTAVLFGICTLVIGASLGSPRSGSTPANSTPDPAAEKMAPYQPRFGRSRPLVAVIGENSMTELIDYVIPYAVLSESDAAQVIAIATQPGPLQMMPALKLVPQATVSSFDRRFPEGADYVIVPAVHRSSDPTLTGWVAAQAHKGATVVGICDGVLVLGHAGLLNGRRATGHWYSEREREQSFPDTHWLKNIRYVADGKIVTTSGVSAAIPASLALVEAIAGQPRATAVAKALGVADWSATHDSEKFAFGTRGYFTGARNLLSFWRHEELGIAVAPGVDEIALALTADAYSRTYRSSAWSVARSATALQTRRGLSLLPDRVVGAHNPPARMLPALDPAAPVAALDRALSDMARAYGSDTATFVSLQLEYPQAPPQPRPD